MEYKHIVIDVSLNPETSKRLEALKDHSIIKNAQEVFFLHVTDKKDEHFLPVTIEKNDEKAYDEYVQKFIEDLKKEICQNFKGKAQTRVIHNSNTKLRSVQFLREVNADLVVVSTRGEQGVSNFFSDSFTFWVIQEGPCDVLVLKP